MEQGCEFKIDQAKSAVQRAVSDIALIRIIVADAELFEFGKQLVLSLVVQMFHPGTAVGRDDPELLAISLQYPGNKMAALPFQMSQDQNLVIETFFRIHPVIRFDDPPIKREVHRRSQRVFDFDHASMTA